MAGIDIMVFVGAALAICGSGGAAWAGVKVSMNGMKERQTKTEGHIDAMRGDITEIKVDLGIVKAAIDE